jgi:membrane protease YdiL (CAAX protease family)
MEPRPHVGVVFVVYVFAFLMIVVASILAATLLQAMELDGSEADVIHGLPGLLAGGLASSVALALTAVLATRGMSATRLRLVPGRETGRHVVMMIVGVLTLGQALDSLSVLVGISERGSMLAIRRALSGTSGPDLFFAVIVIGLLAGSAEEVFFRGYMQSLLRERWRWWIAILVTSACFGLLHLDAIHTPLAFVLGLYLGFVAELAGSALPAMACHVVNNAVFTILTAVIGSVPGIWPNVVLLAACVIAFGVCVVWLTRSLRPGSIHTSGGSTTVG